MTTPIVRKADHVLVPVDDPEPLFRTFTETLELPVAWPISDFGSFRSGGVSFGNLNVELVTANTDSSPYLTPELPAVIKGIALEPAAIDSCAEELRTRGLPFRGPERFERNGWVWTNVYLGDMIGSSAVAFLCAYHRGGFADAASDGGPLGVLGVEEIVIGVADLDSAVDRWAALLAPHDPVSPGVWRPGEGPAIGLRRSPYDGVHGLAVKVRSLARAKEALAERRLLGPVKPHSVGIRHPAIWGLDVWFVE